MTGDGDAVGGFLQLHDAATLRRACEAAAEHAAPRHRGRGHRGHGGRGARGESSGKP